MQLQSYCEKTNSHQFRRLVNTYPLSLIINWLLPNFSGQGSVLIFCQPNRNVSYRVSYGKFRFSDTSSSLSQINPTPETWVHLFGGKTQTTLKVSRDSGAMSDEEMLKVAEDNSFLLLFHLMQQTYIIYWWWHRILVYLHTGWQCP